MKQNKLFMAVKATLIAAALGVSSISIAADKELLDILKANGSISQSQYDTLMKKADKPAESTALLKKMAWAGKIKVNGDLRVRQEFRNDTNGSSKRDDRQRYRARIGIVADVTNNVEAGVRLVSSDSATSTNKTLGDGFSNDTVYFDRAYINWQPLQGLEIIAGKFAQPWQQVSGGLIWDGDVNPEGGALRYTIKLGGAKLIASAGHLVLNDIDGYSFDEDNTVQFAQLASHLKLTGTKMKLGVSLYDYEEDKSGGMILGGGNDSTGYSLQELFGSVSFNAGIPLKLYGQYVVNAEANGVNDREDAAWLLGVGTKVSNWKVSYDYRDTELNAVNGAFNDSDFAGGRTDSTGSRWKVAYQIDKNFSVATTYFDTKVGNLNGNLDSDTWQIDLKAKF